MLLRRSVTKAIVTTRCPTWRRAHVPIQCIRPLSSTQHAHATKTPSPYGSATRSNTPPAVEPTTGERQVSLDHFKRLVDEDKATVDDAKLCLEQSRADIERLPIAKRQEACAEHQVGRHVMLWLISQALRGYRYLDPVLTDELCWFALPESLEEYVFVWIERELNQMTSTFDRKKPYLTSDWRAQLLLGGLVRAHLEWSPQDPNAALRCFKNAVLRFGEHRLAKSTRGLLMSASAVLWRCLRRHFTPPCDEQLFDFIIDHLWRSTPKHKLLGYRARMLLYHPTRPEAIKMLDWLENPGSDVHDTWLYGNREQHSDLSVDILRAAFILRAQGHEGQAQKLEGIVETRYKDVWYRRFQILRQNVADPKTATLRQAGVSH